MIIKLKIKRVFKTYKQSNATPLSAGLFISLAQVVLTRYLSLEVNPVTGSGSSVRPVFAGRM